MLSLNLARRHLDTVDVCKVVDSVADIFERQAKERQAKALLQGNITRHVESPIKALVPESAEQEAEPAQAKPTPKKPEPQARDLAVAAVGNQVSAHPSLVV
ncbi:hypothetical protein [Thiothrix fructosivorans]|uniref:Uncharacterized protein n=1 Tax=Thiothrix fructosivorans TaxID=111770 RepID=A0A8B0SNG1_9GAMM|nr:hypothetical protein [Thiothrix fructosivorans]MBO0612973.1 hypothetical protein [Thiothrix fructosivorans]QTX11578.1 hypothetical protein J1836_004285 [Thiothrix fructosivorans]